jgi:phage baseplate assembly protein W
MAGLSIKFPITDDLQRNTLFGYDYTSSSSIKSRLILLFTTQKGERYMYPEYGTNLRRNLFQPNDQITSSDLEKDVRDAIAKFFPAVTILKFEAKNEGHDALISIDFGYNENSLSYRDSLSVRFSAPN